MASLLCYRANMTLEEALKVVGSRNKIAKLLGCTRQNITRWAYDGIPLVRQYQLEELTDGKLKMQRPVSRKTA